MNRSSGILMAMSSLPGNYGIGTMGKSAYKFVDFLRDSGQKYWQLLPLCPTSYGDSPYSSFSTFAGNPYLIDLDLLCRDKLLKKAEYADIDWGSDPARVDYGKIYQHRFEVLRIAYGRGKKKYAAELAEFRRANAWVENYALFMALKAHFGMVSWTEWPEEDIRKHEPEAVEKYRAELAEEIDFQVFMQCMFFHQWNALRDYAHEQGVEFIGDVPIYVALDSADVWSESRFFQLDEDNVPVEVAGVPPDDFTDEGQLWGNPLYDWDAMKADGYGWWIRRIDGAKKLYDIIRIAHFRGFDEYYSIPFGDQTAERGHWEKGPGMDLFNTVKEKLGDVDVIAEDLGYLTESVIEMVKESGYPGMKVLQFAFDSREESDYLPHNYERNCVVYTGTHDNDTILGWYYVMSEEDREFSKEYMGNAKSTDEELPWDFIRMSMESVANLAVTPMQEFLGLGTEARINYPSTLGNNWKWRLLPGQFTPELAKRIHRLTQITARIAK